MHFKKNWFRSINLTLSHKGFILVCVPLLFELIFVGILTSLLHQAEEAAAKESHSKAIITKASVLTKLFIDAGGNLAAYRATRNKSYAVHYEEAIAEIPRELSELRELVKTNLKQTERLKSIETSVRKGLTVLDRVKMSTEEGSQLSLLLSGHRMLKEVKATVIQLESDIESFLEEERRIEKASPGAQARARNCVHNFLLVGTLLNILLALAMAHFFATGIRGRLKILMENTLHLAKAEPLNPPLAGVDEIAHLDGVFHDMAAALAEATRKERAVVENALDVICSIDADGRFTAVSPASLEVWGYSPEELIGRHFTELIAPEDREHTLTAAQEIIVGQSIVPFENKAIRKNGSIVHVLWSAYWSAAEESMFCVVHDITDRKQAEDLLKASETRVRSIIESMPVGLMIVNAAGQIELVNPQTEKMFSYQAKELVDKQVTVLFPKAIELNQQKIIGHVKEFAGQRKTGEEFPCEVTVNEINTSEGIRFLVNMLDVTERHAVEKLKKEFVSTVSHELRTPLTSIRGSLTLLAVGALGTLSEQANKAVKIAERNSIRLINLINDLLDIEKLEAGKLEMAFENTDFATVLDKSLDSVKAFAEQYGVAVEVNSPDARVFADGDRLVQVLVNLLSNAIKYSPQGAMVGVFVTKSANWLKVSVKDQGRGIPLQFKERIFERFEQVETADAKKKGGTGLGLAICKAIIEQHGGTIGVDSEEGQGSTFWFNIPLLGSRSLLQDSMPEPAGKNTIVKTERESISANELAEEIA